MVQMAECQQVIDCRKTRSAFPLVNCLLRYAAHVFTQSSNSDAGSPFSYFLIVSLFFYLNHRKRNRCHTTFPFFIPSELSPSLHRSVPVCLSSFLQTTILRTIFVTVHSVHSNLVKMHSKSPSVIAFCPVCLGILPYSWQNTSRILPVNSYPYSSYKNSITLRIVFLCLLMFPVYTKQIKSARVLPLLLKHVIIILFLHIH